MLYSVVWQGITQEMNLAMPWPEFRQWLETHLADSRFQRATWGVQIVSLDTGAAVFSHQELKLLSPASNSKLYTVALALETLGPDYRIKTSFYAKTKPNEKGVVPGDLVVMGRGDPTFSGKLHGGDILRAFEPLVFALTNAGVKRIKGDLVADGTFFRGSCFGSGWAWDDAQHYYGAEISPLTANDNILELTVKPGMKMNGKPVPCEISVAPPTAYLLVSNRTVTVPAGGSRQILVRRAAGGNVVSVTGQMPVGEPAYREEVAVHAPEGLFLDFLRQALSRHGIRIGGKLRVLEAGGAALGAGLVELASVDSPPLAEIARLIQKPSQNLYTDLLLAHVGETRRNAERRIQNPEPRTSEELGVKELGAFLSRAGLDRSDVFLEEGSGLSRNNLTTARATVALMGYASRQTWSNAFFEALPVAGVDGTLRNRLKGTPAEGNVRAKTGSLRWADSLSGTVTTAAGERLVFCLMLNRFSPEPGAAGPRAEIDAIASRLAAVSTRTR
jgi:D-alanyl-D-alanine carboxypeptidase/D-alanyl-D-alanine-endopeptidase (penicillin-binding protein 4)